MIPDPTITAICKWVTDTALTSASPEALVAGLCHRLNEAGVAVFRANIAIRPIHPVHGALAYRWQRGKGAEFEVFNHATIEKAWVNSPYFYMHQNKLVELHQSLQGPEASMQFALFETLRDQGGTDYFGASISFEPGTMAASFDADAPRNVIRCSWVSDAPTGFTPSDLGALRQVMSPLALALAAKTAQRIAHDLMGIYLGADAGERVLSGEIGLGTVTSMRTAILYIDLTGFTGLSETLPGEEIIAMLNDYFAAVVPVIDRYGGQVLKFMGDGMLAIFSELGDGASRVNALDAVAEIETVVDQVNEGRKAAGQPVTNFTAALHAGQVLYGNIGAPERLDFTVIGPAVNTAARMLEMCKALDRRVLVSELVATTALPERPRLLSLGQYGLMVWIPPPGGIILCRVP